MPLFNKTIRNRIGYFINRADTLIRNDFANGYVVDENDYTSNLTAEIRRHINRYLLPLRATTISQKVPGSLERKWGVDACIILVDHKSQEGKICLFEAKAIKTNRPNSWDRLRTNPPYNSHFSTQLDRQITPHGKGYAIWEQFYSNEFPGRPVGRRNRFGSTCILHDYAITYNAPHPNAIVWRDADIDNLCILQRSIANSMEGSIPLLRTNSMGEVVKKVCECHIGKPMKIKDINIFLKEELLVKDILFIERGENPEFRTIVEQFREKNEH